MRPLLLLLALLAASPVAAQEGARKPLPDDYTPNACAIRESCVTFDRGTIVTQVARMRGITGLEQAWLTAHWEQMLSAMKPLCDKAAACLTSPGVTFTFCSDAILPEMKATCDRFPADGRDRAQCLMFVEAFSLGRDQLSPAWWRETQACVKAAGGLTPRPHPPIVWTVPATIPRDYSGLVTFYAIDPETKLPVQALVTVEGQKIYSSAAPIGLPTTYYPFHWPVKYERVTDAGGHRDIAAPKVTVSSEWYPPVTLRMPVEVPRMTASMTPPAKRLRPGRNVVTVTTADAATGKPVEARVMMGDLIIGESNQPVTIQIPKNGKRADIWVTSLFNTYGDVVVAPAKK